MTKRATKKPSKPPVVAAADFAVLASLVSRLSPGDEVAFETPAHTMFYIGELQGGPVFKTAGGSWVWPVLTTRCRIVRSPNAERRRAMQADEGEEVDPVRQGADPLHGTLELDVSAPRRYR